MEFEPNNKSFVIIYKQQSPIHYNIKSGHKIAIFEQTGYNQSKTLSYSFSTAGRFFGLVTENHFFYLE